ncbi:PEGA domain-containing protein [Polyangium sorediatum]|uniref:PEGA domain-containing protein n=1 Tax=Polyangium sorediatum TaxID=889274 RepID=A0ABT6P5Z7_9BACT|nr:PEGA domain-containing protein [Polyangium sorediatum]MDI1436035.1 PEGA domain-containing protein [Polyangium sorediatum]
MKRFFAALVALALATGAGPSLAGPADVDSPEARAYFETGAREYEKGNYANAVRAFEQAYALTTRPGLLFSIAQAYRKQYGNDGKPQNLRQAVDYYRRYLATDTTGKRRGEADAGIKDIEEILSRLPPEVQSTPAPEEAPSTQISITTQVEDATISIDGAAPRPLEAIDVTPGKHKVLVQAPGYFPEEREVPAKQGQMTALDVPLREMPAYVSITGPAGASVTVDGLPKGALPLQAPLQIEAGVRTLHVSLNGFNTFTTELDLGRGKSEDLKATLDRTRQRMTSFVLIGGAATCVAGGIVMAFLAADSGEEAKKLNEKRKNETISDTELDDYLTYRDGQTAFRNGATAALNVAAGFGALAFLLYYFDEPRLTPPRKKDDKKPQSPGPSRLREIAVVPAVGPGLVGLSFGARF